MQTSGHNMTIKVFFKKLDSTFYVCEEGDVCAIAHMWRSKDN